VEKQVLESNLEIINVETGVRKVIYSSYKHFEAPNWSRDGKYLLFNGKGRLYIIPIGGGKPKQLNTEFAVHCNNDHGFSPDGKQIVISHHHKGKSLIYVLPSEGGTPRQVTKLGPAYSKSTNSKGRVPRAMPVGIYFAKSLTQFIFALCGCNRLRRFFSSRRRCLAEYGIFVFFRMGLVSSVSFRNSRSRSTAALRFAF